MGIQINGNTDTISAIDGSLSLQGATANEFTVGTGASVSSPATNVLTLGTNNSERVRIDSSGRLGIGTNNPTGNGDQTTIHVHAADYPVLHLTNSTTGTTTSDGSELTLNADGSLILRNRENSFIRFDTNGSEKFRITSTGQLQATGAADVRLTLGSGGTAGTNDSVHIRADGANLKFMNASGGVTIFEQNGTERVRIDSSGRVTTPYQPAFRAVDNVAITLTAGSAAIFPSTSVAGGFNTGGHYSTSTGRFTAPVAGVYYFQAMLGTSGWSVGNTTQDHFTLRVNNNAYVYSIKRENADTANTANGYFTDYGTFTVYLNANDYVTVVPTYTKNSFGNSGYTWFEGFLLG